MRLVRSFLALTIVSGFLLGGMLVLSGCDSSKEIKPAAPTEADKARTNADLEFHSKNAQKKK